MARLACGASRRAASDRARLASARLSPVLDMEEPTSHGAAGRASRRPGVDSRDVHDEPAVGRTSDSRRAPEVGNLSESVDRRQIHAAAATTAVANVADFSHQSREPHHGRRPLRRAHGHLPTTLCSRDPRALPSTTRPRGGHRSSDRSLDGTTASQCLFRERRTSISTPRSRRGLCRRGDHHRRDEHGRGSNAYVERVIGSIRRECLDHVIVVNAGGLRRVLTAYIAYYMRSRTHLALGKDTPNPRPIAPPSAGRIVAVPEVGGLHHRYDRIAA